MAQAVFVMEDDKRLEQISEQIIRYANADFQAQGVLSEKGDQLDSIVAPTSDGEAAKGRISKKRFSVSAILRRHWFTGFS